MGQPVAGETLIGDADFYYSGEYMVGTDCEYLILEKSIENCTGFTLDYKVKNSNGNASAGREIYINDGQGWIWVGSFQYDSPKAYHLIVHLKEATDVYAIAASAFSIASGEFNARQNILDVNVSK